MIEVSDDMTLWTFVLRHHYTRSDRCSGARPRTLRFQNCGVFVTRLEVEVLFDECSTGAGLEILLEFKGFIPISGRKEKLQSYWQPFRCSWHATFCMPVESIFDTVGTTNVIAIFAFETVDVVHVSRRRKPSADFITPKLRYGEAKAEAQRFELWRGCPTHAFSHTKRRR